MQPFVFRLESAENFFYQCKETNDISLLRILFRKEDDVIEKQKPSAAREQQRRSMANASLRSLSRGAAAQPTSSPIVHVE